jgi:hypothetical protein
MNNETLMAELLRWRLAQAEADAPPAPSAARLLELTRPWWETWPERFRSQVERLLNLPMAYGHAMAEPHPARQGHPVPVLLVQGTAEVETSACVLYFCLRDGQLRLRLQLPEDSEPTPETLEVTFVCDKTARPLLSAPAHRSVDNEYRVDVTLPEELGRHWEQLKVTDRMPFRLILRVGSHHE